MQQYHVYCKELLDKLALIPELDPYVKKMKDESERLRRMHSARGR